VGEWHLVWAAVSGMETLLMALLVLVFFGLMSAKQPRWLLAGLLIGVAVWVRPDGLTLLGPLGLLLVSTNESVPDKLKHAGLAILGFAVPVGLYLLFNWRVAGSIWPNTFYAKQAEYASLLQVPVWIRVGKILFQPLIGSGILLLPGFFFSMARAARKRDWVNISAGLWWLGFGLVYALKLPVVYQHARYLIPAMPVYFFLGLTGSLELIHRLRAGINMPARVLGGVWLGALAVVWVAFIALGANSYAQDTAVIESEMVNTARWVADNTPSSSVIAAHDIGALGYFGQRQIIDLAGLISPEVIPFIRDEKKINAFLVEKKADYLMTFPDWYPGLTNGKTPIYVSGGKFAPKSGQMNMAVYPLR
jgi:hypothetical protein